MKQVRFKTKSLSYRDWLKIDLELKFWGVVDKYTYKSYGKKYKKYYITLTFKEDIPEEYMPTLLKITVGS